MTGYLSKKRGHGSWAARAAVYLRVLMIASLCRVSHAWVFTMPTVRELESNSTVIVKARIVEVALLGEGERDLPSGGGNVVRVKVFRFSAECRTLYEIKGESPPQTFKLEFELGSTSSPSVNVVKGRTYVLFLKKAGDSYRFVNEHRSTILADPLCPDQSPQGATVLDRLRAELLASLASGSKDVVTESLEALPELPSRDALRARLDPLLNSADASLRSAAITALLKVGDETAVSQLLRFPETGSNPARQGDPQWERLASELSEVRDPCVLKQLAPLLAHKSLSIRRAVADALRRNRVRSAVPQFVAGLRDEDSLTRYRCLMALAEILDRMNPEWATSLPRFPERGDELIGRWLHWWEMEGKRIDWEAASPATQTSQPLGK